MLLICKGHGTGTVFIPAEPREYLYCPAKPDIADNMHITRGSCL